MAGATPLAAASDEVRWYLINTQATREMLAAQHLARQGYRPFVPATWRSIRHARKIRTERCAYFPGYLFVPLKVACERWRPIDGTIGVIQLIKAGGRPLAAPHGLVESLAARMNADGTLDLAGPDISVGQSVRLIRGPFAEQLAVIDCLSSDERVRVLLRMMGQSIPVDVVRADLAAAQV